MEQLKQLLDNLERISFQDISKIPEDSGLADRASAESVSAPR